MPAGRRFKSARSRAFGIQKRYNPGMPPAVIVFTQTLYDQMLAHELSDPANEMCGLLAGRDGVVEQILPVPNALHSPVAYRMEGPAFVEAMKACDFEPLGIFHSHPSGPPTPSPTDVAEAAYPESIYVIVSLHQSPPSVRAFWIVDGQVDEMQVMVRE